MVLIVLAWLACGPAPEPPPATRTVTVRVGESTRHLAGVEAVCGTHRRHALMMPTRVATLTGVPEGPCHLRLKGGGPALWTESAVTLAPSMHCEADLDAEVARCEPAELIAAPRASGGGQVVVDAAEAVGVFNGAEIECPGGVAVEVPVTGARLVFEGVPGIPCVLWFRGKGPPVQHGPVTAGETWRCTFEDRQPRCVPGGAEGG